MKIFVFSANGMYLRATVVVIANREDHATRMARKELYDKKLPNKGKTLNMKLEEVHELDKPKVLYSWNGDY